jgi:hypothetical protein
MRSGGNGSEEGFGKNRGRWSSSANAFAPYFAGVPDFRDTPGVPASLPEGHRSNRSTMGLIGIAFSHVELGHFLRLIGV